MDQSLRNEHKKTCGTIMNIRKAANILPVVRTNLLEVVRAPISPVENRVMNPQVQHSQTYDMKVLNQTSLIYTVSHSESP